MSSLCRRKWLQLPQQTVATLALGVVSCLGLVACGDRDDSIGKAGEVTVADAPSSTKRPHILLLSIDTLRADHLGCYGYHRQTSPRLDALAAQGVRYQRAMAPTPWTLPSHGALLTGVDPYLLGLTAQWRHLPPQVPTLAEELQDAGYRTAAFVDSTPRGFVGGRRGFARGFERFDHAPHGDVEVPRYDIATTVDGALTWLDDQPATATSNRDAPFFLFLHTRSVHAIPNDEPCRDARCSPYIAPEPFGSQFLPDELLDEDWDNGDGRRGQDYLWWLNERVMEGATSSDLLPPARLHELVALYDGAIAYTDHHVGRLLDGLEARGLADDTLVIVTSDHGEAFFEHQLLMHQEVYDSSLHVPLLLRWPAAFQVPVGQVVEATVTLEDVAPTVLAWVLPRSEGEGLSGGEKPRREENSRREGTTGSATTEIAGFAMTGRPLPMSEPVEEGDRSLFAYYLFPEKFTYRAFALELGDQRLVAHNPTSDDLSVELWAAEQGVWRHQMTADEAAVAALRQHLQRHLRRSPVAEVDDPAHRSPTSPEEALSTLGYID